MEVNNMEYLIVYTTPTTTRNFYIWEANTPENAVAQFKKFFSNYHNIPTENVLILGVYMEVTT